MIERNFIQEYEMKGVSFRAQYLSDFNLESGSAKLHSSENRGVKKLPGTSGNGIYGFPVTNLNVIEEGIVFF